MNCMCAYMSWKQVCTLLHKSTASPELHIIRTRWRSNLPLITACAHLVATDMASGMISAQHFEAGARSFAELWKTCTDAQQLWTWHDSGNALVSTEYPSALECLSQYMQWR